MTDNAQNADQFLNDVAMRLAPLAQMRGHEFKKELDAATLAYSAKYANNQRLCETWDECSDHEKFGFIKMYTDQMLSEGKHAIATGSYIVMLRVLVDLYAMRKFLTQKKYQFGVDLIGHSITICVLHQQVITGIAFHFRRRLLDLMSYKEYILTPEWDRIRQRKLKQAKFKCSVCNTQHPLEVHHKTYERLGDEWDDDLIVLCHSCHQKYHNLWPEPPIDE